MGATAADTFDRSLELSYTALLLRRSSLALRRRGRPEVRGGSDGATLTERITVVVSAGHPDAYCLRCLAGVLMEPEKPVRDAAQLAMVQGDLCVERRTCCQCGLAADALIIKPLD